MSRNCTRLVIAATLASLTGISGVLAGNWPASVVGTWTTVANQSALTVVISSQASGAKCPEIKGEIHDSVGGTQTLEGFYCPDSGRIVFSRNAPGQRPQVYSANLSEVGTTLYMGGLFEQQGAGQGAGEYSFFGSK